MPSDIASPRSPRVYSWRPEVYFAWRILTSGLLCLYGFRGYTRAVGTGYLLSTKSLRDLLSSKYTGDDWLDWTGDIGAPYNSSGLFESVTTKHMMVYFLMMLAADLAMHKLFFKPRIPKAFLFHHFVGFCVVTIVWLTDYGYGYMYLLWMSEVYPVIGNFEHFGRGMTYTVYRGETPEPIARFLSCQAWISHILSLMSFAVVRIPIWIFISKKSFGNSGSNIFCKAGVLPAFYLDYNWGRYHVRKLMRYYKAKAV